jgi:hypothetical protein
LFYAGAQIVTAGVAVPFTFYEWYRHRTFVQKATAHVRKRVAPLRTAFKIFQQVAQLMGEQQPLGLRPYSPAMRQLIKITHKDDIGSLLATQKLVRDISHELAPLMVELGNLDAYAGLAELMVESPQNNYCYALCVDNPEPVLEVKNCWSPVRGQTELGRITTALILAQATGIAPAHSFMFTPFDRVCANSPQNLEPGQRAFVLSTQAVVKEEISLWTTERRVWHAE